MVKLATVVKPCSGKEGRSYTMQQADGTFGALSDNKRPVDWLHFFRFSAHSNC